MADHFLYSDHEIVLDLLPEDIYLAWEIINDVEEVVNGTWRLPSRAFFDLRSQSRAHQVSKKYPRTQSRRKRNCCEWCNPPRNYMRVHRKKQAKKHVQWHDWRTEINDREQWPSTMQYMDEVVQYERFGKRKDLIEQEGAMMVESGERFVEWAQRRVGEMRCVKEDRLREEVSDTANIHTATTLPTSAQDEYGHALLSQALQGSPMYRNYCLGTKRPCFPIIYGFEWFGEFNWAWHRNASGCWQLGYLECGGDTFPCSHCCEGNGSMYYECYCAEFEGVPAPEDVQRCALTEWVQGRLWRKILNEAESAVVVENEEITGEDSDAEDWDLLSQASSEAWSIVNFLEKPQ